VPSVAGKTSLRRSLLEGLSISCHLRTAATRICRRLLARPDLPLLMCLRRPSRGLTRTAASASPRRHGAALSTNGATRPHRPRGWRGRLRLWSPLRATELETSRRWAAAPPSPGEGFEPHPALRRTISRPCPRPMMLDHS
jgi:hypothetical protein